MLSRRTSLRVTQTVVMLDLELSADKKKELLDRTEMSMRATGPGQSWSFPISLSRSLVTGTARSRDRAQLGQIGVQGSGGGWQHVHWLPAPASCDQVSEVAVGESAVRRALGTGRGRLTRWRSHVTDLLAAR